MNTVNDPRVEIEKKIIRKMVELAVSKGWKTSVYDGEEWTVLKSKDVEEVMGAIMTTDTDNLQFCDADDGRIGIVFLVYGNSGWDVICDYTLSARMEEFMDKEVMPYAQSFEDALQE